MTFFRRIGNGQELCVTIPGESPPSTISCVTIGEIVDGFTLGAVTTTSVDVSALGDDYNEYMAGSKDPGSVSFQILFDPDMDSTTRTEDLLDLQDAGTVTTWKIKYSQEGAGSPAEQTFAGHVESFQINAQKDNALTADVTIKLSGDPYDFD